MSDRFTKPKADPFRRRNRRRRGALIYLVAALLVLLMACVAFSVDVAYMQLVRTQLRTANDLAARAGAENLNRTKDSTQARTAAKNIALANKVAGRGLAVSDSQVVFGRTSLSAGVAVFTANATPYNSVRVQGTRTGSGSDGAVGLFFGGLFGSGNFGPQTAATVTIESPKKRDIALVLDRSGSMDDRASWGSSTTKWDDLLEGVNYFFDAVNSTTDDTENVGMATYSTSSTLDKTMTTSYSSITRSLSRKSPDGYTNISDGMEDGMTILAGGRTGDDVQKVLLVMTDGMWNYGYNPVTVAATAKSRGYRVIAITFGDDADQDTMSDVAAAGGGTHYHAPSRATLIDIFTQIGLGTDGLQYAE